MSVKGYPREVLCERARAWAALALDGELSEFERKLFGAHVDRCASCAEFGVQVAAIADALRDAALQPLPRPVSVPVWRRPPAYARVRAVGAAAAVALMALGVAARAPLSSGDRDSLGLPRVTNFANTAEQEVALIIRRAQNDSAEHTRFRPKREGQVTRPI